MSEATETHAPVAESEPPLGSKVGRKRGTRLSNIGGVKAALADVVRELEADRMEVQKARAMVYALSVLAGVIQTNDLEARIGAMESRST